jgi:predicted dehydrogenase
VTSNTASLRIGVIGCGRIAQVVHLPAIAKSGSVQLIGVSDRSDVLALGVAARYGVPGYTDAEKLLQADIDAVLIAVPDRFHLPVALQALGSGKHVLLEKPAASTAAESITLCEAAEQAGVRLQIGAMRRHDPAIRYAREAVASLEGILAADFTYRLPTKLRTVTEATLFPAVVSDESVRADEARHKADRESYLLRTHGAHVFDSIRFYMGEVDEVRCLLSRSGADLHWQGTLSTDRGLASFAITANTHSDYSEEVRIFGDAGELRVESYFPFYRQSSSVRVFHESTQTWTSPAFGAIDPYQRQLEAFAAAVTTGGQTDPNGHDGVAALQIIEAVAQSVARDGAPVAP